MTLDPRRPVRATVQSVTFDKGTAIIRLNVYVVGEDVKDMPTFGVGDIVEVVNLGAQKKERPKGP